MMNWMPGRKRDRDLAAAIQPELRALSVPRAGDDLWRRIRASREAGERVILPVASARTRRHPFFVATAIVAAASAVFALSLGQRGSERAEEIRASGSWFAIGTAFAQTAPVSSGMPAPAVVTRADRFHPMRVVYQRSNRDATGKTQSMGEIRLSVERESRATWRVVSSQSDPARPSWSRADTMHLAAADLRLVSDAIHEEPYGRYSHIQVRRTMASDVYRLAGEMRALRESVVAANRTFDRVLPDRGAPYIADSFAPLFLMGVELHAGWKGRVSVLGWAVRNDDVLVPIQLAVVGEETVRVPAGEIACWRLSLQVNGHTQDYWVRKTDGLAVRSLRSGEGATPSRELVLVSN